MEIKSKFGLRLGIGRDGGDGEGFWTEQRQYPRGVRCEANARDDGQLSLRTMSGCDRFLLDIRLRLGLGSRRDRRDGEGFWMEQRRYLQGVRRNADARVDGQLSPRTMSGGNRFSLDVVIEFGLVSKRDWIDEEGFWTEQRQYLQGVGRKTAT